MQLRGPVGHADALSIVHTTGDGDTHRYGDGDRNPNANRHVHALGSAQRDFYAEYNAAAKSDVNTDGDAISRPWLHQ